MAGWKRWVVGSWNWKRPLKSAVCIHLSVSLATCMISNRLIFHPPPPHYGPGDPDLVLLDPGEEQVACFFLPPRDREPVLLWGHGNAEDLGLLKSVLVDVHNQGFGVLAYDYPGYGLSTGSPGEKSCFRAAARAYRFLVEDQSLDPARVILVGQSVGSGPACWLAERHPTGGLILLSPFLSAYRTVTGIPLIPGDKFHNLRRIRTIREPLLVIHGTRDEAIPFSHGRRLFREHRGPKEFLEIPDAGHNDLWARGADRIHRALARFAARER